MLDEAVMQRSTIFILFALLGCIRQTPDVAGSPQVQPESHAAAPTAHNAPLVANTHAATGQAGSNGASPNGQHLGTPITLTETVRLADVARDPARYAGQTVRTEGTVTAVCQAAGCWMQLADAEQRVHVKMHGHSFFIPRNASGRHARVQAIVVSGLPNGHCEQEDQEQTGQRVARLELDATGVELD